MGCDALVLQGRLKQSERDIRFSATAPFSFRVRGTRAPTDAAVAGRPPYRGLGALGKRAQAIQGQAVQLLRVSGEGRAPHEHGTADADVHPPLF